RIDSLPGGLIGSTDHSSLSHQWTRHQRRFNLRGRQPVTGNVHHVIDTAQQPNVTVVIKTCTVTGEIHALVGGPVGINEPLIIAPNGACHRWPGLTDDQESL